MKIALALEEILGGIMLLKEECIENITNLALNAETGSIVEAILRRGFAGAASAELTITGTSTTYTHNRPSIAQRKLNAVVDLLVAILEENGNRVLRSTASIRLGESKDESILTYNSYVIEANR